MTTLQTISAAQNWNLRVNENFDSVSAAALYGRNPATTTGLTWGYLGGQFNGVTVANGTVAVTASTTNYIVADRISGAVTSATTTTNWTNSSTYLQLFAVVTGTSTITSYTDYRQALGGGGGGSGLANWVEAVNTSSPNATIPVASFNATNAATNVDAVILPKGTGGFALKIADSTTTGGNKRGTGAVDLQTNMSGNAANVASGSNSALHGGIGNKATGANSGVFASNASTASNAESVAVGGSNNTASGSGAVVIGGTGNTASANYSSVISGNACRASGTNSVAMGGVQSVADADYSYAFGYRALVRGMIGATARANSVSSAGARQARDATLQVNTASNTPAALVTNTSAAAATNQFNLVTGSGLKINGHVIVRQSSTGDIGYWDISGACKNVGGTVSLSGTPSISAYGGDASLNTCTVAIVADNTSKCLQVQVTGIASTALIWAADLSSLEIVT